MSAKAQKKSKKAAAEQPAPKPLSSYEKLFKDKKCRTERGLITLHDVEGHLYMEFPLALMGRDLMIGSTVSAITDNRFVGVGEKHRAPMQVTFELDGKNVSMCKRRFDLTAADPQLQEALRRNTLLGIMSNFEIKAYSPDSTAVVLDMTEFFLGNTSELNPFPARSSSDPIRVSQSFKRNLSKLLDIKAFEDNVSIKSRMAYSVSMSNPSKRINYMTDAPFTVEVTRSIVLLPEQPARVRYADPRIGVFFQHKSNYSSHREGVETIYYARRWRLEPSDSVANCAGELVEPVNPIVFYVDNAFPEFWIPYVSKGVKVWNKAFEQIGFKNAVQVHPFPTDDPVFDPDNLKYNCIRYSPSETTNSAGPHWTDPRTGEILNASVYIYHNVVKLLQQWLFVQTAAVDPDVRGMKIPAELIPKCMGDGSAVTMNLRADDSFVADEGWRRSSAAYTEFIRRHETLHTLYLEIGVGANTPVIIKYPFWAMTAANPKAVYACLNYNESFCPKQIESQSICIDGDTWELLKEFWIE
jgi:hypothetical protein